MLEFTALMPIKAASERLPGKNFRDFHGKPLYHWMLDKLSRCPGIAEVIVNTDAPQVMEDCARLYPQVRVLERPAHLLGHHVTMDSLIAHDINFAMNNHFLQTHCTNPLLTVATMQQAMALYAAGMGTWDSLLTVERLQKRLYALDATPINHDPAEMLPTQALEPLFVENSNLFIFSRDAFLAAGGSRLGRRPRLLEMRQAEGIDIDEEADWEMAWSLAEGHPDFR